MPSLIQRSLTGLLLIALAIQIAACYSAHQLPKSDEPPRETIVGVTTVEGDAVRFDEQAVVVRNDTLLYQVDGAVHELPVDRVEHFWVRRISAVKTTIAVGIGVAATIIVVRAITDSESTTPQQQSCPFIYSWNGSEWVFDAEPYGGSTTRGLERDDLGELEHLVSVDGEYRLMVTNEVPETQYTNLAELVVVDHAVGTRVVADDHGRFHEIRHPVSPSDARDANDRDLTKWFQSADRLVWEPVPAPSGTDDRSEVTLTFARPPGARRATLVARVGTGSWGSHMIKSMLALHGNQLSSWYAALDERRSMVDSLAAWNLREELYALRVMVEEPDGWKVGGVLHGGGPFVTEDRALVLDVSRVSGDRLRIRLRPPRGFWAMDAFAVEYDEGDDRIHVQHIRPKEARDHQDRDVLSALLAADDAYYVMPTNDDWALLRFDAPPLRSNLERTVFLHAQGWYRIHLDDSRAPDEETLRRLAEVPGAAARYAAERFSAWRLATR